MDLQKLTELVNELAVARLEMQAKKQEIQDFMENNKELTLLNQELGMMESSKKQLSDGLAVIMKDNGLKSYKTDMANVSRAVRKTTFMDPSYKKIIETKVKNGDEVDGWGIKETEYISIRPIK